MSVANMSVAQTIYDQLKATSKIKMWSWGSHEFVGEQKSNREGYLKFKVNGNHFKGLVKITLELNDTYTIDFLQFDKTTNAMKIVKHIPMQYFDEMGDVIDNYVEYIDDYGSR